MEDKVNEIVLWLQNYLKSTGQKGYVLGLSGGIDSSVVAALLMRSCPQQCLGVIMPAGNLEQDKEHGILAANSCKMPYIEIDLTHSREGLYRGIAKELAAQGLATADEKIVKGNIGARLRMTTLYGVGNALNYLVVGTDNLAESYTGYFTKYGDGGVDILPISHLTKGEVFAMGTYLGVPDAIINKPPSAGFFHEQTDEAEMGVDYDTIDRFLMGEEISEDKKVLIEKLHRISEHKRHMPRGIKD